MLPFGTRVANPTNNSQLELRIHLSVCDKTKQSYPGVRRTGPAEHPGRTSRGSAPKFPAGRGAKGCDAACPATESRSRRWYGDPGCTATPDRHSYACRRLGQPCTWHRCGWLNCGSIDSIANGPIAISPIAICCKHLDPSKCDPPHCDIIANAQPSALRPRTVGVTQFPHQPPAGLVPGVPKI